MEIEFTESPDLEHITKVLDQNQQILDINSTLIHLITHPCAVIETDEQQKTGVAFFHTVDAASIKWPRLHASIEKIGSNWSVCVILDTLEKLSVTSRSEDYGEALDMADDLLRETIRNHFGGAA